MNGIEKLPIIEPEWTTAPIIEPEWRSTAPIIEPEWGRFRVATFGSNGALLESVW